MSRNVGRVDFLVDFDGKALPAQARKIGEKAGAEAGDGFNERFAARFSKLGQELLPDLQRTGRLGGHRISDAMENAIESRLSGIAAKIADAFLSPSGLDNFAQNFSRVDDAANDLRRDLQLLHDEGSLNDEMWGRFGGTLNQWLGKARAAEKETDLLTESHLRLKLEETALINAHKENSKELDILTQKMDKNREATERNSFHWKDLGHNFRQAILIIGAIAAGGESIAVLGSAAGAGLTILGLSLVSLATSAGVVIAGLQGVMGELSELPEGARPAAQAIQNIGDAFSAMQDKIQVALLDGLGPSIQNLTTNLLPALEAGFTGIAGVINDHVQPILEELGSGSAAAKFAKIFENIEKDAGNLVDTIGHIGGALGNLLIIAGPFITKFTGWIEDLTAEFEDFTGSVEGDASIRKWFENGEKVLSSFADLLGGIGDTLANLVTDESVAATTDLLDNLTAALPFLQDLLEVFGELDAFGIIAEVLNVVGNALSPILDLLKPIAGIINTLVTTGLTAFATALQFLTPLFIPLQLAFEVWNYILETVTAKLQPLFDAVTNLMGPFETVAATIFEAVKPALDDMLESILNLLPSPEELADILNTQVIPAIKDFAGWIVDTAIPALEGFWGWISDTLDEVGGFDGLIKKVKPFFDGLKTAIDIALIPLNLLIGALSTIQDIIRWMQNTPMPNLGALAGAGGGGSGATQFQAAGGINTSPTFGWTGEDGPEAIVPLDRPLSNVDASVRAISAFLQGKAPLPGGGGSGSTLNIESGAIVIATTGNAEQTADAVLDRFAARSGG